MQEESVPKEILTPLQHPGVYWLAGSQFREPRQHSLILCSSWSIYLDQPTRICAKQRTVHANWGRLVV
ncbi:hypothetical protein U9M48_026102 [Paspalum notatum var. saurae]|uniref:Uncharacterized protein n=1 Tax=Paspalum notatum var. saurae TaxID=547442 RepID=A0AAQ3WXT5_PASNO